MPPEHIQEDGKESWAGARTKPSTRSLQLKEISPQNVTTPPTNLAKTVSGRALSFPFISGKFKLAKVSVQATALNSKINSN